MKNPNPFRYFKTSPEIIRLAVMMYVRFPLSLRNVEDLLHERGIDICHETVRYWWNRFGPLFAKEIRKKRMHPISNHSNWKWHLDEVFVKINGETHYLWRAVDHEGEGCCQTNANSSQYGINRLILCSTELLPLSKSSFTLNLICTSRI